MRLLNSPTFGVNFRIGTLCPNDIGKQASQKELSRLLLAGSARWFCLSLAICMASMGYMFFVGITSATEQYTAVTLLLIFIVGFAMSAGPLIWVLCSEIQPLAGRDFGVTCSTMANWIANMIIGATFLTLIDTIGSAGTFWLYAGLNVVCIVLTLLFVPETKNISLENIENKLMSGSPLRSIGSAL